MRVMTCVVSFYMPIRARARTHTHTHVYNTGLWQYERFSIFNRWCVERFCYFLRPKTVASIIRICTRTTTEAAIMHVDSKIKWNFFRLNKQYNIVYLLCRGEGGGEVPTITKRIRVYVRKSISSHYVRWRVHRWFPISFSYVSLRNTFCA